MLLVKILVGLLIAAVGGVAIIAIFFTDYGK